MKEKGSPLPSCVGFIMDGNRRWAKEHGKEAIEGHIAGKDKFLEVTQWVIENKIPHAVVYAFSTENWQRQQTEVEGLLSLFLGTVEEFQGQDSKENIQIKIIGRREDFSPEFQQKLKHLEEKPHKKPKTALWVALSYGGRSEIVEAVNKAIAKGERVTEESFSKLLYTAEMPDPDLIIRTGGESRLSNFLPWQSTYSELFFTKTLWPAFTKDEFQRILNDYAARERRIGK